MNEGISADPPRASQIAAAVIGNALEWYDFVIFGYFATVMARVFFPKEDASAGLLLTLATFGAGFVTRPLGGAFFGVFADRHGRKAALQLIMFIMTAAVAVIAFTPPYSSIGVFAPLLILAGRLTQGFATGGEFASATSYLIEIAPRERRGLYGSLQMVGQEMSVLIGTMAGIVVANLFTTDELHAFAWRIPFILGLLIGPVGLYVRRRVGETPAFTASRRDGNAKDAFLSLARDHRHSLMAAFGATISVTIFFYVVLVYMPTYGQKEMGLSLEQAFVAQAPGLLCLIMLTPLMGALSDRIGRRPLLFASNFLFFVCVYPLFAWLQAERTEAALTVAQTVFCVILSGVQGVLSTALAEQFPTRIRSTGLAVAYNLAVMIFGGFAPFIVTWLIGALATPVAPAFYLMFGAFSGMLALIWLKEGGKSALEWPTRPAPL